MTTKRLIRDLERDLKKEPGNLAMRLQLAAAYRESERSGEAVEIYRSVARAYAEQGRHGQAAAVCRSALEVAPQDSELYGMRLHLERSVAATTPPPVAPATTDPATMTASRTRVLPAEVSVRELGSVASAVKHASAPAVVVPDRAQRGPSGPPSPSAVSLPHSAQGTPTSRASTFDGDTPLPNPMALHDTIDRDSVVEMVEVLGRPIAASAVAASAMAGDGRAPVAGRPPARSHSQTRPPPPPPPRSRQQRATYEAHDTEVAERPSMSDFAKEMSTRKLPKLSESDLASIDLVSTEVTSMEPPLGDGDADELGTDPGTAGLSDVRTPTIDLDDDAVQDDDGDDDGDDDDDPTHPPGLAPVGRVSSPGFVGLLAAPSRGIERSQDSTLRGDPILGRQTASEESISGTFDQSFDQTLSALGPDGAALEGPLGVFSILPAEAAIELAHRAVVKQYSEGEVIIREGDPGDACYVVVNGEVAVYKRAPDGDEIVELARLGNGSLFGEFALLADRRRHATVRATTECEVYEIPRLLLRELAASFPEVGPALETFYRERLLSNLLFTTPLFALLPDDQRPPLLARFHPVHAETGQAIVREGDRAGGLYLIVLGAVEVVRRTDERRAIVLATLGEGAYFGEMSLLSGGMASASVIAAGPCELAMLPPRDFYEVVAASPELWSAMRAQADVRRLATAHILAGHTGVV